MSRTALLVLIVSTATASIARAEGDEPGDQPRGHPNGYLAAGPTVGKDLYDFVGFSAEAGMRIPNTKLFGRVLAGGGTTELDIGRGTFVEGRVGAEARDCIRNGMVCGSLGLDVGVHRGKFERYVPASGRSNKPGSDVDDPLATFDSVIAVPRLTIDGGARVRVRGVVELPQHKREGGGSVSGLALSLALGVAF